MMMLLRSLHSIASQRGDGLRPELLRMIAPSSPWTDVEKMFNELSTSETAEKPADDANRQPRSATIIVMPFNKRG